MFRSITLLSVLALSAGCQFDYNVDSKNKETPDEDVPQDTASATDTAGNEVLARSADGVTGQENVVWQYVNADGTEVLDYIEIAVTTYNDMYSEVAIPSCVM